MKAVGDYAEAQAARYLKRKGFRILERNYRCRMGEIDLIAADQAYLLFVEVKGRGAGAIARPMESVDFSKQCRLAAAAMQYLAHHETEKQPRFDVIEVYMEQNKAVKLNHIPNAFELGDSFEAF